MLGIKEQQQPIQTGTKGCEQACECPSECRTAICYGLEAKKGAASQHQHADMRSTIHGMNCILKSNDLYFPIKVKDKSWIFKNTVNNKDQIS